MTHQVLSTITADINAGRPLWALFRANEYMSPEDPLRGAVCKRAERSLAGLRRRASGAVRGALTAALVGKRLNELDTATQQVVRSVSMQPGLRAYRAKRIPNTRALQQHVMSRAESRTRVERLRTRGSGCRTIAIGSSLSDRSCALR